MVQVNSSQISDSILDFIANIENTLRSQSLNGNLPILGNELQEKIDSIIAPVSTFRTSFEETIDNNQLIDSQLFADQLSQIPGVDVAVVSEQGDDVEFSLNYSNQIDLEFAVESNLGLAGFDFNSFNAAVAANVNYSFPELRFGLNNGEAFLNNIDEDLTINFDLQSFPGFSGNIGFLDVDLTPVSDLDFDLIVDSETLDSDIDFLGGENLTFFQFNLSPGSQLPGISGNIDFNTTAVETAYQESQLVLPFTISDISLDASSFVSDFLTTEFVAPIQEITAPIIDELLFLTEPIEILNSIPIQGLQDALITLLDQGEVGDGIITLLDVLGVAAQTQGINLDTRLIEQGINLVNQISAIEINENVINLGNIDFRPENIVPENLEGEMFVTSLVNNSLITNTPSDLDSFEIPILENPGNAVFDLLLGRDTELISYTLPKFQFQGTIGETFPVYPPIGIFVGGTFNLETNLEFGIDTFGLRQGNLEDGFFFVNNDTPEVTANVGPAIGVGLQFGAGSVQVFQGFTGGVNLNLNDPNGDNKVRLNEINFNDPLSIFESELNLGLILGGSIRLLGATLFSEEAGTSFSPEELEAKVDEVWQDVQTILDKLKDLSPQQVAKNIKENIGNIAEDIGDAAPELDPSNPNSALSEGLANLDPFNPNSAVGKGINQVEGELKAGIEKIEEGLEKINEEVEQAIENLTVENIINIGQNVINETSEGINTAIDVAKNGLNTVAEAVGLPPLFGDNGLFLSGSSTNFFANLEDTTSNLLNVVDRINSDDGLSLVGAQTLLNAEKDLLQTEATLARENAEIKAQELILNADLLLEGAELESNELYSSDGNDTLRGGILADNLLSGGGDDLLEGDSDADYLNGGLGDDTLDGGLGDDTLDGGPGNDVLEGGVGNNRLFGEDGDDVLIANLDGENKLYGGRGDDILLAGTKSDTLYGDDGNDTLTTASDVIGNDFMLGGKGNDFLFGGLDRDTLVGGQGDDIVRGGQDNDHLDGGLGSDSLVGEPGNDFLIGNGGNDTIDGGVGNDTVSYESASNDSNTGISITLDGSTLGFDGIDGFDLVRDNVENVIGSQYGDNIVGSNIANLIRGEAGHDTLRGLAGDDLIFGGLGADY
ncbi:MAG: hypothetical protein WBA77_05860, partial [Microcoleaceae cyanobacterium]